MKYSVITFGCRVNQADSLGFEEDLRAAGASAAAAEDADLVVVNTCSVTASADQGARQAIRRVARANPTARIVVTGCYATRKPDEIAELPNVVRIVPNDDKPKLLSFVRNVALRTDLDQPAPTTAERFGNGDGGCGASIEPGVAGRTAFTLCVQTGCAEACSYCIIPATRGRPRSVPLDEVIRQVERVASAGFKEIALTGVHLGSYGRDLSPASSLAALLRALCGVQLPPSRKAPAFAETPAFAKATAGPRSFVRRWPADLRFRISSLEPMDCTPDIVDLVATVGPFAPHFHLPLQHASNRLLAAMRRPYTIEFYTALVDDIRSRIPGASIGSDVIVGFPGESDEDFDQLARYLEASPLTHVHVFPYSDRPRTEASAMPDKVPGAVVRDRARRIREISHALTARFHESQVGRVRRGLTLEDGSLVVTDNYLKVRIPPGCTRNEWVDVTITGADPLVGGIKS